MSAIRLTLRKPSAFGVELFTYPDDIDTWVGVGTVAISVQTVSNRTFMRFVTSDVNEGVYKDFTVVAEQKVSVSFFVKSTDDTDEFTAIIYDQDNSAIVTTYTPHTVDTTWRCFEIDFTVPEDCTTIRVTLNGLVADTYEVDAFAFNKDEIVVQPFGPEGISEDPEMVGVLKQSLSGKRVQHKLGTHWRYTLRWSRMGDDFFDRLILLYESGEVLYLDDGDVPNLTERSTILTNAVYDFADITAPSTTHVGYYTKSANLPASAAQFEDDEYADAWYTDIAAGTLRSHEWSASKYLYHQFVFRPSEYGAGIERLSIRVKTVLDDLAVGNLDGVTIYVWNGSSWQIIARTSSPSIEDITWYTYSAGEAQSMVPQESSESNGLVRILVKSRPYGLSISDVAASVYTSGDQSITKATTEQIEFDTETYDVSGNFDSDTDYSFTAPADGLYLVNYQVAFAVNSDGDDIYVFLYKNGTSQATAVRKVGGAGQATWESAKVLNLIAGDKITLHVQNVSNNDTVISGADDTFMTISGLSPADLTTLGMYYVSLETNPGLGSVEPTHRMYFPANSEADDITVKNRTDGTDLTTANYSIDYENNEIDITGQDGGDVVEYTYSRFREVRIAEMPISTRHYFKDGSQEREVTLVLETITGE